MHLRLCSRSAPPLEPSAARRHWPFKLEVFWPYAIHGGPSVLVGARVGRQGPQRATLGAETAGLDRCQGMKFIAGLPMNPATNWFAGRSYSSSGRADLLHPSAVHHDDLVGHRHRLDLVVGHIDGRGRAQPLVQVLQFGARLHPQLRIQVRSAARRTGKPAGSRTIARPIATRCRCPPRQLPGVAVQQRSEAQDACRPVHALVHRRLRRACASFRLNAMLSRTVMCGYSA